MAFLDEIEGMGPVNEGPPSVRFSVGQLYSFPEGAGWCRHGILVVKAHSDGSLYLQDTYWGTQHFDQNSRIYDTAHVAARCLPLSFDLSSGSDVHREEWERYKEADRFYLPIGGGSERYLIRKNASPDPSLVEAQHIRSIANAESELRRSQFGLDWAKKQYEEWKTARDN